MGWFDENYIYAGGAFLLAGYLIFDWIRDVMFYYRAGWDFSKDSGHGNLFSGEYSGMPMEPAARIFFGYPFIVFVFVAVGLAALFS